VSGNLDQSLFANDDARQINIARKQHRAQILCGSFRVY